MGKKVLYLREVPLKNCLNIGLEVAKMNNQLKEDN